MKIIQPVGQTAVSDRDKYELHTRIHHGRISKHPTPQMNRPSKIGLSNIRKSALLNIDKSIYTNTRSWSSGTSDKPLGKHFVA